MRVCPLFNTVKEIKGGRSRDERDLEKLRTVLSMGGTCGNMLVRVLFECSKFSVIAIVHISKGRRT